MPRVLAACLGFALAGATTGLPSAQPLAAVEVLSAVDALPAHIVGQFVDPIGFAQTTTGESLVLDRRAHTIYAVNRQKTSVREVSTRRAPSSGRLGRCAGVATRLTPIFTWP